MLQFEKQSVIPVSAKKLFAWHEKAGALERLIPPWEKMKILHKDPGLKPGSEIHLQIQKGLLKMRWISRHIKYTRGSEFTDIQVKGPFAKWKHRHQTIPKGEKQSILKDEINYQLRFGLGKNKAKQLLERMFTYRHTLLKHDLEIQKNHPFSSPLTIAITGASGLIGKELTTFLLTAGHRVFPITRKPTKKNEIFWDLKSKNIDQDKLEGMDAVIHLAGENISSSRWTFKKKTRIRNSRIIGTQILVHALNRLKTPPKVFISTSAVGYYGSQSGAGIDESAEPGIDFLAKVCVGWEAEARKFQKGRVVIPRFGIILTPKGGALKKMLFPFQWGFGGRVGSGKQLISWITIDDLIYNLYRLLHDESFSGAINLTSPNPVTNQVFALTLAKVLGRPSIFPLPAFIIRLVFGEMADATLLSSLGVQPSILNKAGIRFYYPYLDSAFQYLLGK